MNNKFSRKILFKTIIVFFIFLTGFLLINAWDSNLNSDTTTALEVSIAGNETDARSCALTLGLFVDSKLDAEKEGMSFLNSLEKIKGWDWDLALNVTVPQKVDLGDLKTCKGFCHLNEDEKEKYNTILNENRVYLDRFEKLMSLEHINCHAPGAILKLPFLGIYKLASYYRLQMEIETLNGNYDKAKMKLERMETFFRNTLSEDKYLLISGLTYLSVIESTRFAFIDAIKMNSRKLLKNSNSIQSEQIKFKPLLSYDELVKRIVIGETQGAYVLFSSSKVDDWKKSYFENNEMLGNLLAPVFYYFFLKNDALNKYHKEIQNAAWDLCVGQTDVKCTPYKRNLFSSLRNFSGNNAVEVVSSNLRENFQKLRKKLKTLEN